MIILRKEIVIGIIRNDKKEVLVSERAAHSHLAYFKEFPGGKIEPGETLEAALSRELWEEVGIKVKESHYITSLNHNYDDTQLTLYFYLVKKWCGEPYSKEGQPLMWIPQILLNTFDFPDANQIIIEKLKQGLIL